VAGADQSVVLSMTEYGYRFRLGSGSATTSWACSFTPRRATASEMAVLKNFVELR